MAAVLKGEFKSQVSPLSSTHFETRLGASNYYRSRRGLKQFCQYRLTAWLALD